MRETFLIRFFFKIRFFFNYNKNVYSEFDNIVPCLFHICCELRVTLLLRVIIYDLNGDV